MGSVGIRSSGVQSGRSFVEDYIGQKLTDSQWDFVSSAWEEVKALPDRVEESSKRSGLVDPTGYTYLHQEPADAGYLPPDEFDSELARVKALPGVKYTVETTQVRNAITQKSETWKKINYSYVNPEKDTEAFLNTVKAAVSRRKR